MNIPFAAAIAAAAAGAPMSNGDTPAPEGRVLLVDGDGLCYYCAGNDDTSPGEARNRVLEKIAAARRASGATSVKILTTARESHKGHRYAVARVKPYQGQRTSSRRPKNWEALREYLESNEVPGCEVELTATVEADDLFSRYSQAGSDYVIYTQDKDMRMVPGWHLDWLTHIMFKSDGSFRVLHNEKVYGRAWFWQQLLMGDTADNIPGLPFYVENEKPKRIGEVGAANALSQVDSDMGALLVCQKLYISYYGDRWLVEILEQGILLWMRTDMGNPFNVAAPGNPLAALRTHEFWPAARAEILQRIAESMVHEEDQSERDSGSPGATPAEEWAAVRAVLPPVLQGRCGSGSLPFDGADPGHSAPIMQQPTWQDRERGQEIRREEPPRVPAWLRSVLPKARVPAN